MGKKLLVLHQEGDVRERLIVDKFLTQVHLHSMTSMCTNESTVGGPDAGLRPLSVQLLSNLAQAVHPMQCSSHCLAAWSQPAQGGFLVGAGMEPKLRAANG